MKQLHVLKRSGVVQTSHDGNIHSLCRFSSFGFVTEEVKDFGLRSDECDASFSRGTRQICVLSQKSVAWMDRVAIVRFSGSDHFIDVQICTRTIARQSLSCIRNENMQARGIVFRVYRHSANAEVGGCTCDANGDFSTIRDQ